MNYLVPEMPKIWQKKLNADEDNWSYRVVHAPDGKGYSFIEVYDEDGMFIHKL